MENRLLPSIRYFLPLLFSFIFIGEASAEFIWDYDESIDTVIVNDNCEGLLDFDHPNSVSVSCTSGGGSCTIVQFYLDSIWDSNGVGYTLADIGTTIAGGTTVFVRYFAMDNSGVDATLTIPIYYLDVTPPVVDVTSVPPTASYDCASSVPPVVDPVVTDNCPPPGGSPSGVIVTFLGQTTVPNTCDGGSFTRTWSAEDTEGNVTMYTQTITINGDINDPIITGFPTSLTEQCDTANYNAWLLAQEAAFMAVDDGCGIEFIINDAPATFDGLCGTINVTFTAIDSCNNTENVVVTYTMLDDQDPFISAPGGTTITIECNDAAAPPVSQILNWQNNLGVVDNCTPTMDIVWSHNYSGLIGGCGGMTGTSSVTYTAEDLCGNTDQITIDFTVLDSNDPDIIIGAKDTIVVCDGAGNTADLTLWLADRAGAIASDVCTDDASIIETLQVANVTVTPAQIQDMVNMNLATGCGSVVTVEFAFTDACDNTSTTDADFIIIDTFPPVIDPMAQNVSVECDNPSITYEAWIAARGGAMASDGCYTIDNSPTSANWSYIMTDSTTGICFNESIRTVEFTVTDNCGLQATTTATFTVVDNISPTIMPTSTDLTEECGGGDDQMILNNWIANYGGAVASDACSDVEWTTFDYTTSTGVVATGVQFVDIFNYPAIISNDCEWSIDVIFTVVDSCDNPSTTMSTFTVTDLTNPILTGVNAVNDTLIVECSDPVPGFPAIAASDNCDANVDITVDSVQTTLSCAYHIVRTRTWTATDDCGNTDQVSQVVIIQDTTDPILNSLPGDVTVSCDMVPTVPVLGTDFGAFDNCDTDIANGVVFGEMDTKGSDPDDCDFYNYTITRTWTATDVCGNSTEHIQTITVQDVTIPTFTAPADTTVNCHVDLTPAGTGNVSGVSDVCDLSPTIDFVDNNTSIPGACDNNYIIERTWTVTDACNNVSIAQVQFITVQDTLDPTFINNVVNVDFVCVNETMSQDSFNNWVADYGNATASDLCTATGDLNWFAAEPGSYDINNSATWPGTPPGGLAPAMCPTPIPGVYRSDTVDFVVYDECDNAITEVGVFNVIDNTPPTFDQCPDDATVDNDPGECYATYTLAAPIISDDCNATSPFTSSITEPIESNSPGVDNVIVNAVTLTFTGLPAAPITATGSVSLVLDFTMLDGEEPTEYFTIFGEDGSSYGNTIHTSTQCGDTTQTITIPAAVFNAWAVDGMVTFTLTPNVPSGLDPIFAINDICPDGSGTGGGSSVDATLNYSTNNPGGLVYEYSINGDPAVTVNPVVDVVTQLNVGTNVIVYTATDCAGNVSTCEYTVEVNDVDLPTISCPSDITYYLESNEGCGDIEMTLPIPTSITDNCPFELENQTQPNNTTDALLTFSYNPNYLEYVADDKDFTFIGTAANAVGTFATFTVTLTGDVDNIEEFYTIYGEDGVALGTTEVGQPGVTTTPANCMTMPVTAGTAVAVFTVPVATFNAWAADGSVDITAESNNTFAMPPSGGADDGINPLCVVWPNGTPDGGNDGISSLFIDVEYQIASPYYYTTGATVTPSTPMLPPTMSPTVTFDLGVTEVFYTVEDVAGNEISCSFLVSVLDTISPIAGCEPTTIFISPSGVEDYILEDYEINEGSWDENCDIATWDVFPNTFDCSMAETAVNVTLTVTDDSGNTASCVTIVSIATEQPEPDYSIGLCGDDNLNLEANPPFTPGGIIFTYEWYFNNVLISTDEDPTIPGVDATDSGPYTVVIEGLTGCTSVGVVNVVINDGTDVPVLEAANNMICTNEDIVLTTQNYSGNVVEYNWYSGMPPSGTYLATTSFPTYTIPGPLPVGSESYFVVVEVDGCVSTESLFETITVSDAPVASTNNAVINVCEGENVILGTNVTGPGYTYEWNGPNAYFSTSQFPPVITNAGLGSAGTYNLVISANGCASDAATTVVNITPAPPTPIVSTVGVVCLGDDITLTANIAGADSYTWISPTFMQVVTATNTLTLTNVTMAEAGNWTLYVTTNGCQSAISAAATVFVEPTLTVIASNDGPACDGDDVQLQVNTTPGATYLWNGPGGFISPLSDPIAGAVSGVYSVTVTSSTGCTNVASTLVSVSDAPTVTAVSNTGAPCVTGSDDIFLVLTVFPPDDGNYEYLWIGPDGFTSVDSMPTLPNGTSIDNGSYTVVVTNGAGCSSQALTTVVNVSDAPSTPIMNAPPGLCEGGTLTLTTTGYVGTNVVYTWMTPLGTITTNVPSLTIPSVTSASSGTYTVMVTVDGCTSNASATATIVVGSEPPAPVASSNAPVCQGQTIELFTDFIPNAQYFWTGPAGFNSTIYNPVIFNADIINEGAYQVQVIISGCESVFSVPINVEVNEAPSPAIATNNGPICIDDSGATLLLSVTSGSAIPGATYSWYDATTGDLVAGPTSALIAPVVDFTNYEEGLFGFYVVTSLNGCESVNSIPTSVNLNTVPDVEAFAGPDILVCAGQAVSLSATAPTTGTGEWMQTNGPLVTIINPSSPTTPINGISAGETYTFVWSLSNGACTDYDSDEVIVTVDDASAVANAGADVNLCNQTSTTLSATGAVGGASGMWSQTPAQAALGVVIIDPTDPNTTVNGLAPGNNYSFVWTLSNSGCGEFAADEVIIEIESSDVFAAAGADFGDCGSGSLQLGATLPGSGTGTWTTTSAGVTIVSPNLYNTTVNGLITGVYTFVWTLDNGACGTTSDEVVIDYESAPVAVNDALGVDFAGSATVDVTANDDVPGDYTIQGNSNPFNGSAAHLGDGEFQYNANNNFAGVDSFTYTICSVICPDDCSTATVIVVVGENAACDVPTIITPNNDGYNDDFVVPCLATDLFPNNEVSIFNQWGDEIFQASPYLNNWSGTYNGEDSPVGTYFFVIEFGNGEPAQSGFIILER